MLKDGRTVATGLPARETPTREVITLMTGRTIEYVFPERRPVRTPTRRRCSRSRGWACAATSTTSRSPCAPARSSASPAWSARAARRSSRPSTAPAGPPRARSASRASGCARRRRRRGGRRRRAGAGGAQEPGAAARRRRLPQHHASPAWAGSPAPASCRAAPRRRRPAEQTESLDVRPPDVDRGSCARSRAATSRRSCSPAGCCATAGCCCSTSPPAASTSAPGRRSTHWSATSPTGGSPSSSSPARSRRCSAWPTACWWSPTARGRTTEPADALDEHRVLDLVMEGTGHRGAALGTSQPQGSRRGRGMSESATATTGGAAARRPPAASGGGAGLHGRPRRPQPRSGHRAGDALRRRA